MNIKNHHALTPNLISKIIHIGCQADVLAADETEMSFTIDVNIQGEHLRPKDKYYQSLMKS